LHYDISSHTDTTTHPSFPRWHDGGFSGGHPAAHRTGSRSALSATTRANPKAYEPWKFLLLQAVSVHVTTLLGHRLVPERSPVLRWRRERCNRGDRSSHRVDVLEPDASDTQSCAARPEIGRAHVCTPDTVQ